MQVNLKQADIEKAIQLYLGREGIQTSGKEVAMTFKNGRKSTGVSVSVVISDLAQAVSVVAPLKLATVSQVQVQEDPEPPALDPGDVIDGTGEEPAPVAKTTSLFSN